jgi:hypothetical protein
MSKLIVVYGSLIAAVFFVACSEDEVSPPPSQAAEPAPESTGSLQARLGVDGGVDGGADGGEATSD